MTNKAQRLSSDETGREAIINESSFRDTPCPVSSERQLENFYAYYRKEQFLTQGMRTIVDGFLGWTTEHLNFIPVGDTYALVDAKDVEKVRGMNWHLQKGNSGIFYALAILKNGNTKRTIRMHQLILPASKGFHVDHKDRNGLDNRHSNLRMATPSQNHANQRNQITRKRSSRYKGVTKSKQKWSVSLKVNGVRHYLGTFNTEEDAARAYNAAAKEFFGEFARVNAIQTNNQ